LWVKDIWQATGPVSTTIPIYSNNRPMAQISPTVTVTSSFGETRITTGLTVVQMEGGASTDVEDPHSLTYRWWFVQPSGTVQKQAFVHAPTFVPDVTGTWIVRLMVSDTKA